MSSANGHEACPCLPLAENDVGAVAVCPQCGVVTLRLQYISLRFETAAFERVASLVRRAQERLGDETAFGPMYREADPELRDEPTLKPH